jgi:hypothetical protein
VRYLALLGIAAPDPPSNLSVNVRNGKIAQVSWSPPLLGHYSSFKLKVKYWFFALIYLQCGNWSRLLPLLYFEMFTAIVLGKSEQMFLFKSTFIFVISS